MEPRDDALGERFEAALGRIGAYFMDSSPLHGSSLARSNAAAEIARRLDDLGIDYAIAGALCLAAHGVVRATEDVDVLIARDGLARFKENWLGPRLRGRSSGLERESGTPRTASRSIS